MQPVDEDPIWTRWARDLRSLRAVVGLGFAIRIALWLASSGSNDIGTWETFAHEIARSGLLHEYSRNGQFNHPPLMGLWATFALNLSLILGLSFAQAFKLLPLAADVLAVPTLLNVVKRRGGSDVAAWQAAAVFATSLPSIWVTSHHGNTDSLCALAVLLAIYLVDVSNKPFIAGLAFAGALNVKLIPLVLAPALFVMQASSLSHALRFVLGCGLGMLAFFGPIVEVGPSFYRNAIAYNSNPNRWGLHFLLSEGALLPFGDFLRGIDAAWAAGARYVMMLLSLALGLWAKRSLRAPMEVGAAVLAMFLVLTPGIGVQYFVFPVLAMAAIDRRRALIYSASAGLFLTAVYVHFMVACRLPLTSIHSAPFPLLQGLLGIPVWFILVDFVVSRLKHGGSVKIEEACEQRAAPLS